MSVEIKELQELIMQEKAAEDKVKKAREEAEEIVKEAHEKAKSMIQELESDPFQENLRQKRKEETSKKVTEITEEYKQKISELNKTAQQNFQKAVEFVVKQIMSGGD